MNIPKVKEISLDPETRVITVAIPAKDSIFVQEPKDFGSPQLISSACIVEGLNIILEHHFHAVQAMKSNNNFTKLIAENTRLKTKLQQIADFEKGQRVTINGLSYQKAINKNSFYTKINS